MIKIKPIFDNVLIEPIIEEKTESGFWLPENRDSTVDPIRVGRIIAVGPGKCATKNGVFIPTKVKVGQRVAYKNWSFIKYLKEGQNKELAITQENNILAILE